MTCSGYILSSALPRPSAALRFAPQVSKSAELVSLVAGFVPSSVEL